MSRSPGELVSTTALARQLGLGAKIVFNFLSDRGWIERVGENWRLTGKGEFEGGEYIRSKKYGEYIGWPPGIAEHAIFTELLDIPVSAAALGNPYGIAPHRLNALLAELGWQKRFHKGWTITASGERLGGIEREDNESGVPYTVWPRSIADNATLAQALEQIAAPRHTDSAATSPEPADRGSQQAFDLQPAASTVCRDGHQALNAEDALVDNWLYLMNVVHAYRWPLADASLGCCDFYLPAAHLHLECWHSQETAASMREKLARIEYYRDNDLAMLQLDADQITNLDAELPRLLLKFGITVY